MSELDIDVKHTTLVYAALWARNRTLEEIQTVSELVQCYSTHVFLRQISNLAVDSLEGHLQKHQV